MILLSANSLLLSSNPISNSGRFKIDHLSCNINYTINSLLQLHIEKHNNILYLFITMYYVYQTSVTYQNFK